jgi:hypothetical protein
MKTKVEKISHRMSQKLLMLFLLDRAVDEGARAEATAKP